MLYATLIAIAAFVAALLSFLANAFQVREGFAKMFGSAAPVNGAAQTTNVFHVRSHAGLAGIGGAVGAGVALTGEDILRHADVSHGAASIIGDAVGPIPEMPPMHDLGTAGDSVFAAMGDLDDLIP